jgi:K+-transporting ATPase ATPase C chain
MVIMAIGKMSEGQGKGVTIQSEGRIVGYENIGQRFVSEKYFWGRPSAVDYNAAGSGGSNKAPSNPDYLITVKGRIDSLLAHHPGLTNDEIPVELITASGSGLDPNISIQGAKIQAKRIALARNTNETSILKLIDEYTEKPLWGVFGPARVNVLKLNIALDQILINRK